MAAYTQILDLVRAIEPPPDGKVSRTILQDQHLKAVLFGFSEGQELSEHAASTPAVMHFLKGTLQSRWEATALTPPRELESTCRRQLPHSINTRTPVVMLLLLLKSAT